jgi:hypothetical protein
VHKSKTEELASRRKDKIVVCVFWRMISKILLHGYHFKVPEAIHRVVVYESYRL